MNNGSAADTPLLDNGGGGSLLTSSNVFNPIDIPVVPPLQVDGGVVDLLTYTNDFNPENSTPSLQEDSLTEVSLDPVDGVVSDFLDRDVNINISSLGTPGENAAEPVLDYLPDGEVFQTADVIDDVIDVVDMVCWYTGRCSSRAWSN